MKNNAPWDEAATNRVLSEVHIERELQHAKWGQQDWKDGTGGSEFDVDAATTAKSICEAAFRQGVGSYRVILHEEVCEAFAEFDQAKLRTELVQVAAVAVAWIEAIDRRSK